MDPECVYCGEPVTPDDEHFRFAAGIRAHSECHIRMTIGSVGHLQRRCRCYGGTHEDPPGLTLREAARAAADLYRANQEQPQRN